MEIISFVIWYLVAGAVSFCVLYTIFAIVFTIQNDTDIVLLPWFYKGLYYGLFAVGYIGDVFWNLVFGTVLFMQSPLWTKDQTLTKRMRHILRTEHLGFRPAIANFICDLLHPFDNYHCGRDKL